MKVWKSASTRLQAIDISRPTFHEGIGIEPAKLKAMSSSDVPSVKPMLFVNVPSRAASQSSSIDSLE